MNIPVFQKLDSIISDCEALIKEYQLIEQQIDKPQSSIFRIFRVNRWKANYQKLDAVTCKIDMKLSQLNFFYDSHQNKFSHNTDLYIREYIRYFKSVSYAANLRLKIQKNIIDDLEMKVEEQKEELRLNSRLEDLDGMTAALKKCEQNAVSVNKIVEKIRANG
jgi:hypothetical protein